MKRSMNRILTTHTGSLARHQSLREMLVSKDQGKSIDMEKFHTTVRQAVVDVVKGQVDSGVDIVSDGEQSKVSFLNYVKERIKGFDGEPMALPTSLSNRDFPEYAARNTAAAALRPTCGSALAWKDFGAVQTDIDNLKNALRGTRVEEAFIPSPTPGEIAVLMRNRYYPSHAKYVEALGDVMQREYEAIANAGIILQLDAPDMALRAIHFPDMSFSEWHKVIEHHVEVLNHATRNIPPEMMRLHLCMGPGEGPHNHDENLRDILDLALKVRPAGLCMTAANGRHEAEWRVWRDHKLPAGRVLMPGVVDNTTNIVEHPETVADRIVTYANVAGRENVIASVDCGFSVGVQLNAPAVDPKIAWTKLKMLSDGAMMASKHLWAK